MLGEWAPFPIPRKEWVSVYITAFSWMATLPEVSSSCQSHLFPSRNITIGTSTFHQNSRESSLWVAELLAEMGTARLVPLMETGTKFPPWLHRVWGLSHPCCCTSQPAITDLPWSCSGHFGTQICARKAPKINIQSLMAFWGNHRF